WMEELREKWKARVEEHDHFPTGYFASDDGTRIVMRVFSTGAGLGGGRDEELLERVEHLVAELRPESFHPEMNIGFGGDIPNARAEKESLISTALFATGIASAF